MNSEIENIDRKKCLGCLETINIAALRCRYCGQEYSKQDVFKSLIRSKISSVDLLIDGLIAREFANIDLDADFASIVKSSIRLYDTKFHGLLEEWCFSCTALVRIAAVSQQPLSRVHARLREHKIRVEPGEQLGKNIKRVGSRTEIILDKELLRRMPDVARRAESTLRDKAYWEYSEALKKDQWYDDNPAGLDANWLAMQKISGINAWQFELAKKEFAADEFYKACSPSAPMAQI